MASQGPPPARLTALRVMLAIAPEEALPQSLTLLKEPDPTVQLSLLNELYFMGSRAQGAAPDIIVLLDSPHAEVRRSAALALVAVRGGQGGDEAAVKADRIIPGLLPVPKPEISQHQPGEMTNAQDAERFRALVREGKYPYRVNPEWLKPPQK